MMHEGKGQHIGKAPSLHLFHTTVHGSLPKMYHKLPWDETKTMLCILQHYHKSALQWHATYLWYNLDPELEWAADWS